MQRGDFNSNSGNASQAVAHYLNNVTQPQEKKALGNVVLEILREGKRLSRKSICTKLLSRLEQAPNSSDNNLYQKLIGQLFEQY